MSARSRRRSARPDLPTVVKDLLLFGAGFGLIVTQGWFVRPQDFNLYLLLFGGVLVNVPGAAQLWQLRTGVSRSPGDSERHPSSSDSSPNASTSEDDR